jgi:hypothetical protein
VAVNSILEAYIENQTPINKSIKSCLMFYAYLSILPICTRYKGEIFTTQLIINNVAVQDVRKLAVLLSKVCFELGMPGWIIVPTSFCLGRLPIGFKFHSLAQNESGV